MIGCRHGNRTEQLTASSSSSRSGVPSGGEEVSEGGGAGVWGRLTGNVVVVSYGFICSQHFYQHP